MKPDSFRVIFKGQIAADKDPTEVKINIAKLFKLDPAVPGNLEKLKRMFSGKAVVIKDKLPLEAAEKYQRAIKQAGAVCHIKPMPASERRKEQRRRLGDRRAVRRTSSILPDRRKDTGRRETDPKPED